MENKDSFLRVVWYLVQLGISLILIFVMLVVPELVQQWL